MKGRSFISFREEEEEEAREGEEEEDIFFDARDDISSVASSNTASPCKDGRLSEELYFSEVWLKGPGSARARRDKFVELMGFDQMNSSSQEPCFVDRELKVDDEIKHDNDRISLDSGPMLMNSSSYNTYSMSSRSSESTITSSSGVLEENFICTIKNLDSGTVMDELPKDRSLRSLLEVGPDRVVILDEFKKSFGRSSLTMQLMQQEFNASICSNKSVGIVSDKSKKSTRVKWLRRLAASACMIGQVEKSYSSLSDYSRGNSGRVKVHRHNKQSKELTAVYKEQEIKAHDGAILTMEFSHDGQYLATGGEDGALRVWHVMECKRTNKNCIQEADPSSIYFTVNHSSELAPLHSDNEKKVKPRVMRICSDSACVVIPPNVFRLSEEPIHEFRGHESSVLDISWSKTKCLLSSSMDKTVRLWKVGSEGCLKVFPHFSYVTSVEFNPVDERYFISGSIDGKVRIWDIPGCHVAHWVHIKDIITAACYRPDGKGAVVGTLSGDCRFYNASDSELQIEAQISLHGKKKSQSKRIISFQFCPGNPRKLMVTSANSKIRILDGVDVVSKFKGPRNSGSPRSASFTADGQHIISASENSNIYVWNHNGPTSPKHVKSTCSCERFFSSNASLAIPWHGFQSSDTISATSNLFHQEQISRDKVGAPDYDSTSHVGDSFGTNTHYLSPSGSFTLRHELFSEFLSKSSATWPEERLPSSFSASALSISHYKFLRTCCQNTLHAWDQVIVTAGWDGWIRSYQNYGLPLHC